MNIDFERKVISILSPIEDLIDKSAVSEVYVTEILSIETVKGVIEIKVKPKVDNATILEMTMLMIEMIQGN